MKTKYAIHEYFDELVNVIKREFPTSIVNIQKERDERIASENTATDYLICNWDFGICASVDAIITRVRGTPGLKVVIPGKEEEPVFAWTPEEVECIKKLLIAACREYCRKYH